MFSLVALSQEKKSAILFFDMNNSFNEIEAAKKAAKKRGDILVVYPEKSLNVPFDKKQLNKALKEISEQNITVNSIIISGHHSKNDGYYGEVKRDGKYLFNQISPDEFRDEISKFPNIRNSIRSLFGAGCHTMTKPNAKKWVNYFKNLETCYGYMALGPMNSDASASQNIYDFLVKEKEISALNSVNEIFKLGSSIFKYPQMTNSAIWTASTSQYCDVKGRKSVFTNCQTHELNLKKYYTMLEAKVMKKPIEKSLENTETFGKFYKYPDLDRDPKGNYIVSDRISIQDLEFLAKDAISKIQTNCEKSKLLEQLSFFEIETIKEVNRILLNHRIVFAETLKTLEKMGINYPTKQARFEEYEFFYNEVRSKLSDANRDFKEKLNDYKKSKKINEVVKIQKGLSRLRKIEKVVQFMKEQYVDKKCLKKQWFLPYTPETKEKIMGPMKEDPDFCKNY